MQQPDPSPAPVPVPVPEIVAAIRSALDGGPAAVPLPRTTTSPLPAGTALVVRTSGSTGTPREVTLGADALRASASATHERMGGPGRWVLTLPATHVAGLQVVVRSVLAGAGLTVADPTARFTPDDFADLMGAALRDAGDEPVYTSLVPTQLHRLVAASDDGAGRGLRALARSTAVLLGGAATPPRLLARAREAGVRVVTTYGMSETAGGCVYDGMPLRGARVRITQGAGRTAGAGGTVDDGGTGLIELGGPMLASGYVGDPVTTAAVFRTDPDGSRWFRTNDLGRLDPDGELAVLGRADDVVVTGGANVAPAPVEALLGELLGGQACVVGVPDAEWGQALVAVVTDADDAAAAEPSDPGRAGRLLVPLDDAELAQVRAVAATRLGPPSAPRRVYRVAALPVRGPGKVDRRGVVTQVLEHEARA